MRKLLLLSMLLLAPAARATITLVSVSPSADNSVNCNSGGSIVTSQNCSLTATPTVGNFLVIGLAISTNSAQTGDPVITDNQSGNTYSKMVCSSTGRVACLYGAVVAGSSGTFTITATLAGGVSDRIAVFVLEYSGTITSSVAAALDTSAIGESTGTPVCPSLTLAATGEMLVEVFRHNEGAAATITAPAGFTRERMIDASVANVKVQAIADQLAGSTSIGSSTWGGTYDASTYGCAVVAIKPAAGAVAKVRHKVIQ